MWATFIPLGLFYGFIDVIRVRRSWRPAERYVLMVALVLLAFFWWIGLRRMPRFAIPLLALACVFSAPMFSLLHRSGSAVFRWLLVVSMATACLVSAFSPLHDVLGRIRMKRWDRPFVYGYPAEIDNLPIGSSILDIRRDWDMGFNKFALAGRHLTNRVVPGDWLDVRLSRESLRAAKIDYIFDYSPFSSRPLQLPGVRVLAEGHLDPDLNLSHCWRLYMVALY